LLLLAEDNGVKLDPSPGSNGVVEPPSGNGSCPDVTDYDSLHVSGDTVTVENPLRDPPMFDLTIADNPKCSDFGLLQALKTDEAPEGPKNRRVRYLFVGPVRNEFKCFPLETTRHVPSPRLWV
jgi:hypothetical protein